jgi:hypothetical protein
MHPRCDTDKGRRQRRLSGHNAREVRTHRGAVPRRCLRLRRAADRSREGLWQAIGRTLDRYQPQNAATSSTRPAMQSDRKPLYPKRGGCEAGPRVRIHLPPAASQERTIQLTGRCGLPFLSPSGRVHRNDSPQALLAAECTRNHVPNRVRMGAFVRQETGEWAGVWRRGARVLAPNNRETPMAIAVRPRHLPKQRVSFAQR